MEHLLFCSMSLFGLSAVKRQNQSWSSLQLAVSKGCSIVYFQVQVDLPIWQFLGIKCVLGWSYQAPLFPGLLFCIQDIQADQQLRQPGFSRRCSCRRRWKILQRRQHSFVVDTRALALFFVCVFCGTWGKSSLSKPTFSHGLWVKFMVKSMKIHENPTFGGFPGSHLAARSGRGAGGSAGFGGWRDGRRAASGARGLGDPTGVFWASDSHLVVCQSLIGWWFGVTNGDFAMAKCKKSPDLVGGFKHEWIIFHNIWIIWDIILMSSFSHWRTPHIFQDGHIAPPTSHWLMWIMVNNMGFDRIWLVISWGF